MTASGTALSPVRRRSTLRASDLIEALHLASGRTICKLHLQEGGLHADINGDGVLDHVQVVGGNGAEQTVDWIHGSTPTLLGSGNVWGASAITAVQCLYMPSLFSF